MADAKVLVRHATSGHPAGIAASDTATAPAFKATNNSGNTVDANGGKVANVATPTLNGDAANKSYVDTAAGGRVPTTRTVTAGAGLSGGGALSADITVDIELAASSGLKFDTAGAAGKLMVDFGSGAAQAAPGNHTHATLYQPLGNELTALQALADTAGLIKKTGDGTYVIDTTAYLSSIAHTHTITAGAGLINGGSVSANGSTTLDVGAGKGIAVAADSVALDFQGLQYVGNTAQVNGIYSATGGVWKIDGIDTHATAADLEALTRGGSGDGLHSHEVKTTIAIVGTAGEAIAQGEVLCMDLTDGKIYKASNALTRGEFVGIAATASAVNGDVSAYTSGVLHILQMPNGALATGRFWLGPTAGKLESSAPTSGRSVRIGFRTSASAFVIQLADFGEV